MAKEPKKGARRTPPKRPSPERMAEILSHADIATIEATAAKYNVSERTIWRWKASLANGELPKVADLVARLKEAATQRCKDLLTETFESSLRRIGAQLPQATISEAVKAAEMCGDLLITRRVLNVEGDSEGEAAPGDEGLGGRAASSAGGAPSSDIGGESRPVH